MPHAHDSAAHTHERENRELSRAREGLQRCVCRISSGDLWFPAVSVQLLIFEVTDSALSRVTHIDILMLAVVMSQRTMQKPTSEGQSLYLSFHDQGLSNKIIGKYCWLVSEPLCIIMCPLAIVPVILCVVCTCVYLHVSV